MSIENPGSLREYAEKLGTDPIKVADAYSEELAQFRSMLAESKGITLDELHYLSEVSFNSGNQLILEYQRTEV